MSVRCSAGAGVARRGGGTHAGARAPNSVGREAHAATARSNGGRRSPRPVAPVEAADGDPVKGKFTLEDATKGLAGTGKLFAELKTDKGTLECELYPDKAPITVATFVGLARGTRPWKTPGGEWVTKPLYDGTPFHRIIKGFMIQGGDPKGNGSGDPGFVIPDEIWPGAHHDEIGQICMANRGPNTNTVRSSSSPWTARRLALGRRLHDLRKVRPVDRDRSDREQSGRGRPRGEPAQNHQSDDHPQERLSRPQNVTR